MTKSIIPTFITGIISPELASSIDLEKARTGLIQCENFIVDALGGVKNRPGLQYIDDAQSTAKQSRLIPFQFNVEQSYILEFADSKMRIIKDGGLVESGGSPAEIVTPYPIADVAALEFTQSADTLYVMHADYRRRKITRTSHTAWTVTEITEADGPYRAIEEGDRLITINALEGVPWTLTASSAIFDDTAVGDPIRLGFPVPGDDKALHWAVFYVDGVASDTVITATPVEEDQNGIVYEEILNWDFKQGLNFWTDHTGAFTVIDIVDSVNYEWIASGSGTNEYYLRIKSAGDPGLTEPDKVIENEIEISKGTLGSLSAGEWGYGNNDALSYDTIYARLTDNDDPDNKADGYLKIVNGSSLTYDFANNRAVLTQGTGTNAIMEQEVVTFSQVKHRLSIVIESVTATWPLLTVNIGTSSLAGDIFSETYHKFSTPETIDIDFIPTADDIFLSFDTKGRIDIRTPAYKWTLSGFLPFLYYLELAGGGDPGLLLPDNVYENDVAMTYNPAGPSGALGEWAFDDKDGLTYDTIYVKLNPAVDPDTKPIGWVEAGYDNMEIGDIIEIGSVSLQKRENLPGTTQEQNTTDHRRADFNANRGFPQLGIIHEQRFIPARNSENPQTLWPTETGNFESYGFNTPTRDTDSFSFNPPTPGINGLEWLLLQNGLNVGTAGETWKVFAASGGAITPSDTNIKVDSSVGSLSLKPIAIGNSILLTPRGKEEVVELTSSFEASGYTKRDLSVLASHLFKDRRIVRWAYAREPDSVIWCVLDNGKLLGLTYFKEYDTWAWHEHTTPLGEGFKDIAVIPNSSDDNIDDVFFVVNRAVSGATPNYYIEQLNRRITSQEAAFGLQASGSPNDYKFLDSAVTFDIPVTVSGATQADPVVVTATGHGFSDGDYVKLQNVKGMTEINNIKYKVANKTANTFELNDKNDNNIDGTGFTAYLADGEVRKMELTLGGLDHLEGETVTALADGRVESGLVVSGGQITLSQVTSFAHIGIPYVSIIETPDIEILADTGSTQGRFKGITKADVYFKDTRGAEVASSNEPDDYQEIAFFNESFGEAPPPLFTGSKEVTIAGVYRKTDSILIRNTGPVPIEIKRIIPDVEYGG